MAETGNSEVLGYELYWDANSGVTNIKLFEAQADQFTFGVQSLVAGLEYKFKIRAHNIYGFGDYSDEAVIIPDAVPAMMNSVVTTLAYPMVTFAWEEPFNNGRQILAYQLEIYSFTDLSYVLDDLICDAASASSMQSNSCDVDMSILLGQYGYAYGQMIIAKVRA